MNLLLISNSTNAGEEYLRYWDKAWVEMVSQIELIRGQRE